MKQQFAMVLKFKMAAYNSLSNYFHEIFIPTLKFFQATRNWKIQTRGFSFVDILAL